MHVVRHQAITHHRHFVPTDRLPQQFEVDSALGVAVQKILPTIAPLRHMVRHIGDDHSRQPRHRSYPSALHRIRSPLPAPCLFRLGVIRSATGKVKRNSGGRVNLPENKSYIWCLSRFSMTRSSTSLFLLVVG